MSTAPPVSTTLITPQLSTVTETTTTSVASISTETIFAPPPSSSESSSSSLVVSTSQFTTPTSAVSSGVDSLTSPLTMAMPSATALSSTLGNDPDVVGAADSGTNPINADSGRLNVGAIVGIAIGVVVTVVAVVLLAYILFMRPRRRKAQKKTAPSRDGSDSERGTSPLPRGGMKTFADVVEAGRDTTRSPSPDSLRSNPFADRLPEMTVADEVRRSLDRVYEQAISRSQREADQHFQQTEANSIRSVRTSGSFYYPEESSSDYSPRLSRDDPKRYDDRRRSERSIEGHSELDVAESASIYLRNPFSTPEPREPPRRSTQRPVSPKRYLYPEMIDWGPDDDEDEDERPESRVGSDAPQLQPTRFQPN